MFVSDIIYLNIQSMLANKDSLIKDFMCYRPAILLLSESRTIEDVQNFEILLDNYRFMRCDSSSRHTGVVLIYIRADLNFVV